MSAKLEIFGVWLVDIGILVVLALSGLAVVFYLVVVRRDRTADRQAAWKHVVDAIDGSYKGSKICGTYQGKSVEVFLNDGGYEIPSYSYFLRLKTSIQGFDWNMKADVTSSTDTAKSRNIQTDDKGLKQRLNDAGAVELVDSVSTKAQLRYRADKGTLEYQMGVADSYVPTSEEFQTQLNLLTKLAELNEKLNVW